LVEAHGAFIERGDDEEAPLVAYPIQDLTHDATIVAVLGDRKIEFTEFQESAFL